MICLLWFICFKKCISVYGKCSKSKNSIGGSRHRDKLHISAVHDIASSLAPGVEPEALLVGNEFGGMTKEILMTALV